MAERAMNIMPTSMASSFHVNRQRCSKYTGNKLGDPMKTQLLLVIPKPQATSCLLDKFHSDRIQLRHRSCHVGPDTPKPATQQSRLPKLREKHTWAGQKTSRKVSLLSMHGVLQQEKQISMPQKLPTPRPTQPQALDEALHAKPHKH